ncbi:MAG: hypothetical protein U9N35_01815 [Euryarchaeota archaeon]|nr:hypothetical protein [Euryarchaeota archaeon]
MDKKSKMVGIAAVMAVIVSLLVVSVPAKESEGAEKIPKEEREWMAREEKKIQEELKDPEFVKKLERSKNRKWYSYEELYGKEKEESTGCPACRASQCGPGNCHDRNDITNGGSDEETDLIYYYPGYRGIEWAYVHNCDSIKFWLSNAEFEGVGAWVQLDYDPEAEYSLTWENYQTPAEIKNQVANLLYNQGVPWSQLKEIHVKYFVQATGVSTLYHMNDHRWVCLGNKAIELWSEANYDPNDPPGYRWQYYGYPTHKDGGASTIESQGYVYTSTGNSYYNPYNTCVYRHFDGDDPAQQQDELCLYSHPWHQQAIVE